jgi:hypothetical protein
MTLLDKLDQYILKQEAQVMVEILTWQLGIPKNPSGGTTPLEMFG